MKAVLLGNSGGFNVFIIKEEEKQDRITMYLS